MENTASTRRMRTGLIISKVAGLVSPVFYVRHQSPKKGSQSQSNCWWRKQSGDRNLGCTLQNHSPCASCSEEGLLLTQRLSDMSNTDRAALVKEVESCCWAQPVLLELSLHGLRSHILYPSGYLTANLGTEMSHYTKAGRNECTKHSGDGCITMRMYIIPWNCTFTNG